MAGLEVPGRARRCYRHHCPRGGADFQRSRPDRGTDLSTFFLGIIVLAVVGNAADLIAAVYFARRDRMGLVMTITVGSTIQAALFTAPVLVLVSYFLGSP